MSPGVMDTVGLALGIWRQLWDELSFFETPLSRNFRLYISYASDGEKVVNAAVHGHFDPFYPR